MKKVNSKTLIAIVTGIISIVWIYLGVTQYGLLDPEIGPKPGLFPTAIGCILLLVSVIGVFSSFKEEEGKYTKAGLGVGLGAVALLLAAFVIGVLPALLIFYILWEIFVEKLPAKTIVISTLVVAAIVYGVFVYWLQVPFDKGMLYEMIMYS